MDLRWSWRINLFGGRSSISTFATTQSTTRKEIPAGGAVDVHLNCMQFISHNATCYRPYSKTGPLLCIDLPFPHRLYLYACPMEDPNFHPSQWWEFRLSSTTTSTTPTTTSTTTPTTPLPTTTTTSSHKRTPKPTTTTATTFAEEATTATTASSKNHQNDTTSTTNTKITEKLNLENLFGISFILLALLIFCCIRMERRAKKRQQQQQRQQPRNVFVPSRPPFTPQQLGAQVVPLGEISPMFALDEDEWDDDGPVPQQQQQPIPQPIEMEDMPEEEEERRVRFADRESIYYSMPDIAERELPPIPDEGDGEEQQQQTDN